MSRFENIIYKTIDLKIEELNNIKHMHAYRNPQQKRLSDIFIFTFNENESKCKEYIFIISDCITEYWQVKENHIKYLDYVNQLNLSAEISFIVYFYKFNKFKKVKAREIIKKNKIKYEEMEDFDFENIKQFI